MTFLNRGAIPHVEDKAGREAFKKKLIEGIAALGGKPKKSLGLEKLRKLYSELAAKGKE